MKDNSNGLRTSSKYCCAVWLRWMTKGSCYEMKRHTRPLLLVVGLSAGKQSSWYHNFRKVREIYLCETNIAEVFSKFIQMVTRINHACSYLMHAHGFLSENKNEFKLWNILFFFSFLCQKVYCY